MTNQEDSAGKGGKGISPPDATEQTTRPLEPSEMQGNERKCVDTRNVLIGGAVVLVFIGVFVGTQLFARRVNSMSLGLGEAEIKVLLTRVDLIQKERDELPKEDSIYDTIQ